MLKTKFCHSEQSEESGVLHQILCFAQNDKALKDFRKKSMILVHQLSKYHLFDFHYLLSSMLQ